MAERRPPGFNVDLGFYDSDEVLSIPRKIRAAAVGVWTLCGSFSANKMTDGYVSAEALRDRGCTPAIRAALKATTKANGSPSPLWQDARDAGIQFTGWPKWQRTSAEIKAYREAESERKREARAKRKNGHVDATRSPREPHLDATWSPDGDQAEATQDGHTTSPTSSSSGNGKTSDRTSAGHPPESRDPKTETKTETEIKNFGHLSRSATDPDAHGIAATIGAQLLDQAEIDPALPVAAELRKIANDLAKSGQTAPADIVEGLVEWNSRTGIGPGVLRSLISDVVKRRNGHVRAGPNGTRQTDKTRAWAELAAEERVREQTQLVTGRKELT